MTAKMMDTSMTMKGMQAMDAPAMGALVEACSACEQACTICADSMMSMDMMGADMMQCLSMCLDCADMSNTMMRLMLRPSGYDMPSMMAMMTACKTMATACADCCTMHAEMSEQCALCAQACMQLAEACEGMMTAMKAMS
ncbi:hypothetical protein D6T64_12540 [Cryobacterium melibiosiphilum]|uniref:Four-helix bundle copper-binding protein n=2 Tax=Cryobacterium melibiosiphilum TaxID=995039 RepID=A0A3A5MGK0_9MICO|nr:hypothetical protein D6T64_12540 [Cryobacterium melibiosiphilum]